MCWVFLKLKIDDPLSAAPMHGWVGMWACIFVGLLAKPDYIKQSYDRTEYHHGAFYPGSSGRLFASQVRAWTYVDICGHMWTYVASQVRAWTHMCVCACLIDQCVCACVRAPAAPLICLNNPGKRMEAL